MLPKLSIRVILIFSLVLIQLNVFSINHRSLVKTYADGTWLSWKPEMLAAERVKQTDVDSKLALINLYFCYTGHLIEVKDFEAVFIYIHKAEVLINEILAVQPSNVTALSYKGAFYGFRVATNRIKYLATALEGLSIIYKAYDMDKKNLIAVINKASALYFLPPVFGGNKLETIKLLHTACFIMEHTKQTTDNWMYLYTLIFLGRSYEKVGNLTEAKQIFELVLQIEPEFKWVKNELYPAILTSLSK